MKRKILLSALITLLATICLNSSLEAKSQNINTSETNIDITQPSILKEQAIIFYKNNNYSKSLAYFSNIADSDMDQDSFVLMANCYDSMGDFKNASESLIKALELGTDNSNIYYNLGILHYKNGNLDYSIENFIKAIKYKKNFKEAYYNLGNSYFLKKDYKNALKQYLKANYLDPNNGNIVYNLALTYKNLENKQKEQLYLDKYKMLTSR